MNLRHLSIGDVGQVYDSFCSVSVSATQDRKPDYGFFEYNLSERDIKDRLALSMERELGMGLFDKVRMLAYVLAYPYSSGKNVKDEVLQNVVVQENVVYCDQLFIKPSLPVFFASRMLDCWTYQAMTLGFLGVFCAIPQSPWKNFSSTRFAINQGFKRRGFVSGDKVNLGVFTKPFWRI